MLLPGNTISKSSRRRAFTLIELLVVIAILSLLVSILLPSLQNAKELARSVLCRSNQAGVGKAFMFYANDYKENIPAVYIYDSDGNKLYWREQLAPYIGAQTKDSGFAGDYPTILECPTKWYDSIPSGGRRHGTGLNVWCRQYDHSGWIPVRLSQIPNQAATFITMDTMDQLQHTLAPYNWNPASLPFPTDTIGFHHEGNTKMTSTTFGPARYGGNANAVFFDGHGESLTEEDTGNDWEDTFWQDPLLNRP
jgi:prepilin-type N-terminal cleavage/methylation domain-containing protein/prepilin-type processing-associated H-X9-DG protein